MNNLSKIIKASTLTYILPFSLAGLLFSIVFSVFGDDFNNRYIGKMESDFDSVLQQEKLTLYLHNQKDLVDPPAFVKIYTGDPYGLPVGLITTARSAQLYRTLVNITADNMGDEYRVVSVSHGEEPYDIASMFANITLGDIRNKLDDISTNVNFQAGQMNETDSLAGGINTQLAAGSSVLSGDAVKIDAINVASTNTAADTGGIYNEVGGQSITLGDISLALADVYILTDNLHNEALGLSTDILEVDSYLISETDQIDTALGQRGIIMQAIWDIVGNQGPRIMPPIDNQEVAERYIPGLEIQLTITDPRGDNITSVSLEDSDTGQPVPFATFEGTDTGPEVHRTLRFSPVDGQAGLYDNLWVKATDDGPVEHNIGYSNKFNLTVLDDRVVLKDGSGQPVNYYYYIQQAVDAAQTNYTIMVGPGTYLENIIIPDVAMTIQSTNGRDATIIDGGGINSVAVFGNSPGVPVILDGFTIKNGLASAHEGAGISGMHTNATIRHCIIEDNHEETYNGGGIWMRNSLVVIDDCIIRNNTALNGGGIHIETDQGQTDLGATITNCEITGNTTTAEGGGIRMIRSAFTMANCHVHGNTTGPYGYSGGGGLSIYVGHTATITNSTFDHNTAERYGSGVDVYQTNQTGTVITLVNCEISHNTTLYTDASADPGGGVWIGSINGSLQKCRIFDNAPNGMDLWYNSGSVHHQLTNLTLANNTGSGDMKGYGIIFFHPTVTDIDSTIIWGNSSGSTAERNSQSITVTWTDIYGGWTVGGGHFGHDNINLDPLFVSAAIGDFNLQSWSPCINTGNPAPGFNDPDGTRADMGALYYNHLLNQTPELNLIGNKEVYAGNLLQFDVWATDGNPGDILRLTATPLPQGASFVDHGNRTGTFTWTPTSDQVGNRTVHFEVSDGRASDYEDVLIVVRQPGGPCFLAGTPILMSDGSSKPIEQIKAGDELIAFDEATGEFRKDTVSEFFEHKADNYLVINGHLKVTANHIVYSDGKWVEIGRLKVGDNLFSKEGKPEQITSKEEVKADIQVYNLEVKDYHTYIAGGIVAHNKPVHPPYTIAWPIGGGD